MGAEADIGSIKVTRSSLGNRKIHFLIRFDNTGDTKDHLWVKIVEYDEDAYVQVEGEGKTIFEKKTRIQYIPSETLDTRHSETFETDIVMPRNEQSTKRTRWELCIFMGHFEGFRCFNRKPVMDDYRNLEVILDEEEKTIRTRVRPKIFSSLFPDYRAYEIYIEYVGRSTSTQTVAEEVDFQNIRRSLLAMEPVNVYDWIFQNWYDHGPMTPFGRTNWDKEFHKLENLLAYMKSGDNIFFGLKARENEGITWDALTKL